LLNKRLINVQGRLPRWHKQKIDQHEGHHHEKKRMPIPPVMVSVGKK
jgi:hypothetical protein